MSFWDDLFKAAPTVQSDEIDCLNKANASPQVKSIDDLILERTKNWKPTGYFTPAEVQTLLATLEAEVQKVGIALRDAPMSTGDARAVKDMAFADILRKYTDKKKVFEDAVAQANANGTRAINAPSLKDFVLGAMRAISDGYVTAAVLSCRETGFEKVLQGAYNAMVAIGGVTYHVLGVAVEAGEAVVDALTTSAKIVAWIAKVAPWAAIGVGGYVGWRVIKKSKRFGLVSADHGGANAIDAG